VTHAFEPSARPRIRLRLLSEADVRSLIGPAEALEQVRTAFVKLARGEAVLPEVMSFDFTEHRGEAHAKGAYLQGMPYFSLKVASGFYNNPAKGLPVAAGLVLVFDAMTGRPALIAFDNGYLTELRTGAAGALAAELLAPRSIWQVGILGCGGQARYQFEALVGVRRPERAVVYCRTDRTPPATRVRWRSTMASRWSRPSRRGRQSRPRSSS
jgi:ornithine cyclodeaminase